jgi:ubiquinone/menaquinone biosynthesis C-methylase UbiE
VLNKIIHKVAIWIAFPGYVPDFSGSLNFRRIFVGEANVLKRLQLKKILEIIAPMRGEKILDYGCSSGFVAAECAKRGADAIGVDICKLPGDIGKYGKGELVLTTINGSLPLSFASSVFDKVFLSEVLIVLDNPVALLRDLRRLIKPGGELVILNTLGRISIKNAYSKNSLLLRVFKFFVRGVPPDYERFSLRFLKDGDRLKKIRWYSKEEIQEMLSQAGFLHQEISYPFKKGGLEVAYWWQFYRFSR